MLTNPADPPFTWLRAQLNLPQQPAVWLAGSLLLAAVATNLAWLARRSARGSRGGAMAPFVPALLWLGSSLYLLLAPLGAWYFGAVSPYLLGLSEIDWVAAVTGGALPAALIAGLAVLGWLAYRRSLWGLSYARPSMAMGGAQPGSVAGGPYTANGLARRLTAPVDAALKQWHWTFYRAAAAAWLLDAPGLAASRGRSAPALKLGSVVIWTGSLDSAAALYWGAWLGLGVVVIEGVLNPFLRAALGRPAEQPVVVRTAALAVATTALFALTRNFWLCLACQVAVETSIAIWWPGED